MSTTPPTSLTTLLNPTRWALVSLGLLALLTVLILGVHSWLAARDAVAQLSATVASQKQTLAQVTAREDQRDAAVAKTVASIKRAAAAVKTPAEAAEQIPLLLPSKIKREMADPRRRRWSNRNGSRTSLKQRLTRRDR